MFERENIDLKSLEELNTKVREMIPLVVRSLETTKDRASVSLSLTFQLCEDSDTHIKMVSKLTPKMATHSKALLCARDLTGNLSADAQDLGKPVMVGQTGLLDKVKED